ncbi:MAG: CoA transferase, partial [Deltaproteobacteria bacterium]|nr:CoA transferase [Deltaproteobacteria bacterium]
LTGLLAAIVQRERTGRGQFVDAAMFDGSLSLATMIFAGVSAGLEQPEPGKMLLNGRFPCYRLYRTNDGAYMSLGALEFKFWKNFCETVGREDLVGGQFGGPEVVSEVEQIFASRTIAEWVDLMTTADACCEPVVSLHQAVESPLAQARKMVNLGPDGTRHLASPLKMSGSPPHEDLPAPLLGQHTKEILGQLGLQSEHFEALATQGVI